MSHSVSQVLLFAVLQNRDKILKFGDIAAENLLLGILVAIGKCRQLAESVGRFFLHHYIRAVKMQNLGKLADAERFEEASVKTFTEKFVLDSRFVGGHGIYL